ncbi:MAG: hypothetical protein HY607_10465 [Planctomycetes bacterium]|uniref:hypothetical protein n=1 Tax=Candidatus Wunengus californicus TaxID=3367619 RepID=UPI004025740D|nr:hypothetical protein [Planctomycetota bacterium]
MFTRFGEALMNQCLLCIDTPLIDCYNNAFNIVDKITDLWRKYDDTAIADYVPQFGTHRSDQSGHP